MPTKNMTITLTGDIVERLQPRDEADLTQLVENILRRVDVSAINNARKGMKPESDPETRIAALFAAVENFWDGMSEQEIDDTIAAMNTEYSNFTVEGRES